MYLSQRSDVPETLKLWKRFVSVAIVRALLLGCCIAALQLVGSTPYAVAASHAKSETKLLVGYQGWFRCPGDGSPSNAWSHWSRGAATADSISVDLYPDISEMNSQSLCPLPGMTIAGKQAYVFSSYPLATTELHFAWMQHYGIDGALLQRFSNSIPPSVKEGDSVLKHVMTSAQDHNRVFAIEYDVSGCNPADIFNRLQTDWRYLTDDLGVTKRKEYLRLHGRPVVSIWGLGLNDGHHIVDPDLALKIIHWFKDEEHVSVMGGTPAGWASLSDDSTTDERWRQVYASMDVVQPWTVGRYSSIPKADSWARTHLVPDMALVRKNHQLYMPVIFPGFSWHNLNRNDAENQIPRLGGRFLWAQAYNARIAGATLIKIAMFDEVNEGTAIMKAASTRSDAPDKGYWLTLDADGERLPADWYLRVASQISRLVHGSLKPVQDLPMAP